MDFNIEVRKKQLQSLDQYITSSKDKVQSILDYLGWNATKTLEKEPTITCTVNSHHKLTINGANAHMEKCFVKSSGYRSEEKFLSEPTNDPLSSIKLDHSKKIEILNKARESNQKFKPAWNGQDFDPMTSDRVFTTYSSDERLAIYEYCVQNTEHPPTPSEFNIQIEDKKEDTHLTHKELLAKERDAKRRRIKYKPVHTSRKKSHTEIIREVIENQMEQYKDFLASKIDTSSSQSQTDQNYEQLQHKSGDLSYIQQAENIPERPNSSTSRHSNYSSSSKRKKEYDKYERSYKNHDSDHKRDYKYEKRSDYSSRYDHNGHKESWKRQKVFEDNYKYSRDGREYHKSERRH